MRDQQRGRKVQFPNEDLSVMKLATRVAQNLTRSLKFTVAPTLCREENTTGTLPKSSIVLHDLKAGSRDGTRIIGSAGSYVVGLDGATSQSSLHCVLLREEFTIRSSNDRDSMPGTARSCVSTFPTIFGKHYWYRWKVVVCIRPDEVAIDLKLPR